MTHTYADDKGEDDSPHVPKAPEKHFKYLESQRVDSIQFFQCGTF